MSSNLYAHQSEGIDFLYKRPGAMLCMEMGLGKTRTALLAAKKLFDAKRIDRVLVLYPAAVAFSWRTELDALEEQVKFLPCGYAPADQSIHLSTPRRNDLEGLPVLGISYSLLPQKRHVEALSYWCAAGKTILICDESSFLKNRTAKQTKGAAKIAERCQYRWLLTGTPIANGPLDLYGQSLVMSNGKGPLKSFSSFYSFRARYAVLKQMNMGQVRFQQVVGYQNIPELTKRFAPYVLRRTKEECLDLPAKTYTTREVQLASETWQVYQELKRDALLALGDGDVRPEPNAAVRLLRLCQLTSGHVGASCASDEGELEGLAGLVRDVSSEKLSWLVEQLTEGELSTQNAVIIWCRWRRERERLFAMLAGKNIERYSIFGGQQTNNRNCELGGFSSSHKRRVLLAQPHAGGYGLNLTAASTAVYLSNDFSYTTRIQSEDRCHRIGQHHPVTYVDVVAVGPKGQRTVDAYILDALRAKKDIATLTCAAWRKVLE